MPKAIAAGSGLRRELASGQWQARYRGPDGIMRPADRTFPSKTEAERWLTRTEADILNDDSQKS